MSRYTAERRQEIIEDFCRRHGGRYDAAEFLAEVKARGRRHPAHAWFEFDRDAAALQHNLWQARMFAQGLRVTFEVQEIYPSGRVTICTQAPLVISPLAGRAHGGGYFLTDLDDPAHVAELAWQAANGLRSWCARYGSILPHAGLGIDTFEDAIAALERVSSPATAV